MSNANTTGDWPINSYPAYTNAVYSTSTVHIPVEPVCDICDKKIEGEVRHLILGAVETVGKNGKADAKSGMIMLDCVVDVCMDCVNTKTLQQLYAILWKKREAKDAEIAIGIEKQNPKPIQVEDPYIWPAPYTQPGTGDPKWHGTYYCKDSSTTKEPNDNSNKT